MSAGLHPQVRALIDAPALPRRADGPADLEAERAAYLQTALELGGAVEEVARVEDVVIPGRERRPRCAARAYWPTVAAERARRARVAARRRLVRRRPRGLRPRRRASWPTPRARCA